MQHDQLTATTSRKRLFPFLATWWAHFKAKPKEMYSCGTHDEGLSLLSTPDVDNDITASNKSVTTIPTSITTNPSTTTEAYQKNCKLDDFTRALDEEGLLFCRDSFSKQPVLTICHGFLDSELSKTATQNEEKYKESFSHLDKDQQESYIRLFASQYPMEPLVDGLPGSVWLECVEPTLAILKALNTLKHRKSNLSIRKCFMPIIDSNAACHGDFETAPLMVNPFVNGHQLRLLRVHFLALEGVLNAQSRNNQQNSLHEVQEDRHSAHAPSRPRGIQHRRHLRMYRPYEILHSLFRNADQLENIFEFREIIRNESNYENGQQNAIDM